MITASHLQAINIATACQYGQERTLLIKEYSLILEIPLHDWEYFSALRYNLLSSKQQLITPIVIFLCVSAGKRLLLAVISVVKVFSLLSKTGRKRIQCDFRNTRTLKDFSLQP
jgi:hypothetical protein